MNKNMAIQVLIDLGLNTGEAKTYVALIIDGPSAATPLAKKAGVPQPKIYEYLKNLDERTFIVEYETTGRSKKYEAVAYNIVLDRLEKSLKNKIDETKLFFENVDEPNISDDTSMVHVKAGEDAVLVEMEDIIAKASKNILIIVNDQYSDFFNRMQQKYDIEFDFISPASTPGWLTSMKMKFVNNFKNKMVADLTNIQPNYVSIDVDYERKTAVKSVILTPGSATEEAFIIVFKHPLIVNYQTKVVLSVMETLQDKNFIDQI